MAFDSGWKWDETFEAAEDLSSSQFFVVTQTASAETCELADSQGELALGIVQNNPESGQDATVRKLGYSKAIAGSTASGVVAAGALVTAAADGRVEVAASGDYVLGRAVTASAAENQVFTVDVFPQLVPLA